MVYCEENRKRKACVLFFVAEKVTLNRSAGTILIPTGHRIATAPTVHKTAIWVLVVGMKTHETSMITTINATLVGTTSSRGILIQTGMSSTLVINRILEEPP